MDNNVKILSTRPLVNNWNLPNITVTNTAFIKIKPVDPGTIQPLANKLSAQNANVLFTSVNAVEAILPLLSDTPNWNLFCIGGRTKELLLQRFNEQQIIATAKNGSLLAPLIAQHIPFPELYFFCGDKRMPTIPAAMQQQNIKLHEIVVYQNQPNHHTITEVFDGILFYSPTAVHSFFATNTVLENTVLFSIGETTTESIQQYCANQVLTCTWPDDEHMMALVKKHYQL